MNKPRFLLRAPSHNMEKAERTFVDWSPVDFAEALRQHDAYAKALEMLGAEVHVLPALDEYPDCAFIEDTAIAVPEAFVLTRPGAASRRGEVVSVAEALPQDRVLLSISGFATLDGGDLLRIGRNVFVGNSTRTDQAGIDQLSQHLLKFGYVIHTVPVAKALHLKTAVTALPDGRLLLNPAWVDADVFGEHDAILIDPDEPFGANTLTIGDIVMVQANAPRTAEKLERLGFELCVVDISQFNLVEAGLTCLSVEY